MAEPQIPDGLRMAAYRAARDWATEHRHPQPDDRMVDAVLAALFGGVSEPLTWPEAIAVATEALTGQERHRSALAEREAAQYDDCGHEWCGADGGPCPRCGWDIAQIARGVAAGGAEQMTVERVEARDEQED